MKRALALVFLAVLMGFLVATFTGAIISPERATELPGGSLSVGLAVGFAMSEILHRRSCWRCVAMGGLAGLASWALYGLIFLLL